MGSQSEVVSSPVPIWFSNTLTGKREILTTREPGKVKFYSCGPTVYGPIHVGNLRAAVVADLIVRTLRKLGYDVTFVRNYTDIDDRIIEAANQRGVSCDTVVEGTIAQVEADYRAAGLFEPTVKPRVTQTIPEILQMIESLIARGLAYVVDGDVFFEVSKFEGYGKLSKRNLDDESAGARVEVNQQKRAPADFALWKKAKQGEPSWESPWGAGRPGWHIECSAMAKKWLGDQMDLHHGGPDLIFPHHENEIAQSEGASGIAPFSTCWVHHAFITLNSEKMSKSLGNVVSAHEFLERFGRETTRFLLLSSHYKSLLEFTNEMIDTAVQNLSRIYQTKQQAVAWVDRSFGMGDLRGENLWGGFIIEVDQARAKVREAMAQDLGTPEVFGIVFTLVREWNRIAKDPAAQHTASAALASGQWIDFLEREIGGFLGILLQVPDRALQELEEVKLRLSTLRGKVVLQPAEADRLVAARWAARQAKDFAGADAYRKQLEEGGVVIQDSSTGSTWSYRS